jgi:hypothetical protein
VLSYSINMSLGFNWVDDLVILTDLNKKGQSYDKDKCICDIKKRNS